MLLEYKVHSLRDNASEMICIGLNKIVNVSAKAEDNDIISIQIPNNSTPQEILNLGGVCTLLDK